MGCYGSWAPTPHLDELARTATVFDNAVTVSPSCQPARLSLALGQYPHNSGLWSNGPGHVAVGAATWMKALEQVGYDTSSFGKLHLGRAGKDCAATKTMPTASALPRSTRRWGRGAV